MLDEIGLSPERTIPLTLNDVFRLGVTYTDLRRELDKLEEQRSVTSAVDGTDMRIWGITPEGEADLAERSYSIRTLPLAGFV